MGLQAPNPDIATGSKDFMKVRVKAVSMLCKTRSETWKGGSGRGLGNVV